MKISLELIVPLTLAVVILAVGGIIAYALVQQDKSINNSGVKHYESISNR